MFQPLPRLPLPSDSPTTDANSSPGLLGRSVLGLSYHLRRLQVQHWCSIWWEAFERNFYEEDSPTLHAQVDRLRRFCGVHVHPGNYYCWILLPVANWAAYLYFNWFFTKVTILGLLYLRYTSPDLPRPIRCCNVIMMLEPWHCVRRWVWCGYLIWEIWALC